MTIYKVLSIAESLVLNGEEKWFSLDEALNELAEAKWELEEVLEISMPQKEKWASEKWIGTVIMVNRTLGKQGEIERQINKVANQIQEVEGKLKDIPDAQTIKRTTCEQEIRELSKRREQLHLLRNQIA